MAINCMNYLFTRYSMFLIRNKHVFRNYLELLCIINHVIFGHHSDPSKVMSSYILAKDITCNLHIIMSRFCLVLSLFRISSGPFYFLLFILPVLFSLILISGPISCFLCIFVCFFVFLFQQTCLWCVCACACVQKHVWVFVCVGSYIIHILKKSVIC